MAESNPGASISGGLGKLVGVESGEGWAIIKIFFRVVKTL
jgi:hypothetical protein